jgi:parallel beta-helix repeat protein
MVAAIALAFLMLMSATASGIARAQTAVVEESAYTPHAPIRINGNADFAAQAAAEGWPGDGSEGNPYVIEGHEIDGTGHGYCIYVGNTTVHFVVKGCYVHNASGHLYEEYFMDAGVYLWNVQNCSMENNIVSNNDGDGIRIFRSNYNIISNNVIYSNGHEGLFFSYSGYNLVSSNNLTDNRQGILISRSTNNSFNKNLMWGNGFRLDGFELVHFNSHNIDTLNTVNEKPVYYLKDMNGGTVAEGAGQVILVNCKDITVENQNISNVSLGISLFYSNHNIISNNTVLLKNFGSSIRLECSDGNFIINNTLRNQNVTLLDDHEYIGINLWDSDDNTIIENYISDFQYGILVEIFNTQFHNNIIRNNTYVNNNYDYEVFVSEENNEENSDGVPPIYIILTLALVAIFMVSLIMWKRKKNNREGE